MKGGFYLLTSVLSDLVTKIYFLFLITTSFYIGKNIKKTSRNSWIRWDTIWYRNNDVTDRRVASVRPTCGCSFLSVPQAGMGIWVKTVEITIWCARISFLLNTNQFYIKHIWASAWDFQQCGMCDQQASDQPAHTRSLIRAFASCLSILWLLSYWLNSIWSVWA